MIKNACSPTVKSGSKAAPELKTPNDAQMSKQASQTEVAISIRPSIGCPLQQLYMVVGAWRVAGWERNAHGCVLFVVGRAHQRHAGATLSGPRRLTLKAAVP
jgi:hypothetical protein